MDPAAATNHAPGTAILFFTHVFDPGTLAAFEKLRQEAAGYGELFLLTEAGSPPPWPARVHRFDFAQLKRQYPRIMGESMVPGNAHLPVLDFGAAHPEFEHYWVIEYDVRFSGPWETFFAAFQANTADLIGSHVRTYEEEPNWHWWPTLQSAAGVVPVDRRMRAFLPAHRISRRALMLVAARAREGWCGHHECLIPTVLKCHGLTLEDIGGDGLFTPNLRRHRFYTSISFQGELQHFGSMRFRPPLAFWGGRADFLYHPVKNGVCGWRAVTHNLVACLHHCFKELQSPRRWRFLRALARHARVCLRIPGKRWTWRTE